MNLGTDALAALPALQSAAESMMLDTCTISSETQGAFDTTAGTYPTTSTVIYTGKCQIKVGTRAALGAEAAGQLLLTLDAVVKVPLTGTETVGKGHIVQVTASVTDPALVGFRARITGPFAQTFATCRRFTVEVIV